MIIADFALYVGKKCTFKKCAKTSISGSNLKTTKKQKVRKVKNHQKTHFLCIFDAKSAILFVKIRLIIHFLRKVRAGARLVFGAKSAKFDLLIEVFALFFRVPV